MSGINTNIAIQDNASSNLNRINDGIQNVISSFVQLDHVLNGSFDTTNMDDVVDGLNRVRNEITKGFGTVEVDVEEPTVPDIPQPEEIVVPTEVEEPIVPNIPEPDPIPITWDVEEVEVFTGDGMARFEQEVNAVNTQMEKLNDTQRQLGRTAAGIEILPDDAYMDIQNMSIRIEDIREQISMLEKNPMDLNIDQVNNELESLRRSLSQAEQQQTELNTAMERMDGSSINRAYNNLNRTISNTEREIRDNVRAQTEFTSEVNDTNSAANQLWGTFGKVAGVITGALSAREVIGLSDTITQTTARLDLMNDGLQTTEELQQMIFQSAERSRGSYLDSVDAVASLGGNAKDAFENTAEIVRFSELLNKQFTIAGTSAEGVSAATLQITQAMGMGALRGEELNSVLEQAPPIVQAIADYMEVPMGQIKDMASEGLITSEVVKNAMFSAADDINAKFEEMPMTFSQIWTSFKNYALMSFQPVLQRLNDIANSPAFQTFVQNAIEWVAILAQAVTIAFEGMAQLGSWVADHWNLISPAVYGVVAALLAYVAIQTIAWTVDKLSTAWKALSAAATWALKFATDAQARSAAIAAIANMAWSTKLMIVVGIIIAIIAAIYLVVAAINHFAGTSISATGLIAGAVAWLAAFVVNVFLTILNIGVQVINALVIAFQVGLWAIQVALYVLGLAFVFILDAIVNTGILAINLLVNAWNFGIFAIQLVLVALATIALLIFDGILNTGIVTIEFLANAWNLGIYGIQMAWIGLNMLVRNVLQAILNFGISVAESFVNGWNDAVYGVQNAFYQAAKIIAKILQTVGSGAIGIVNSVLSGISSLVNAAIGGLNSLIGMANKIPGVNISSIGTVDFQVSSGVQDFVDNIGAGITAPVRPETVSFNRSTMGTDYMNNVEMPSMPDRVTFDRSSVTEDFLSGINLEAPSWENAIDYQGLTDSYINGMDFPEFPELSQTFELFEYVDMGEWFDAGYEWGENLENNVKDFDLQDWIGEKLGLGDMDESLGEMADLSGIGETPGTDELAGTADEPGGSGSGGSGKGGSGKGGKSGTGSTPKSLKDIANGVDDINDSLDASEEDLQYLRDLAAREVINRNTTYQDFHLDFSGANYNVENESDLDGVVDYVARGVQEVISSNREGV